MCAKTTWQTRALGERNCEAMDNEILCSGAGRGLGHPTCVKQVLDPQSCLLVVNTMLTHFVLACASSDFTLSGKDNNSTQDSQYLCHEQRM